MSTDKTQLGENLRRLRQDRSLSLRHVAGQAGISIATLSRVETNKQNLDVDLLLTLAEILDVRAADILDQGEIADDQSALARGLAKLRPAERTKLFLDSSRRRDAKSLETAMDDLLSTIEILRDELLEMQRIIGRRKTRGRSE